jgi:hypothetical protein
MPKVKFLKDTRHPELGEVKAGEVLAVTRDYVRDYEALGLAVETDDELTVRTGPARCSTCGQIIANTEA